MWGETGITRMFDGVMGGQIAWLIPAALIFVAVGLWLTRSAPRTDEDAGRHPRVGRLAASSRDSCSAS